MLTIRQHSSRLDGHEPPLDAPGRSGTALARRSRADGIPFVVGLGLLGTLAASMLLLGGPPSVEVVRSALGKDAKAPANAQVIEQGLATMQANWYWFLLAVIPLALAVLLGAVGLGVSRSSEWLFKLVVAMVAVIAFAPALVA